MGGYIQGGGHSPLSSLYGMAADQALSYEVVTADGRFVTANADSNPDLFWALRGGGGSTYGVVTSVVIKAYPKLPVTIMTWTLMTSATVNSTVWWEAIRAWWQDFSRYTSEGQYMYWNMVPLGGDQFMANMAPWFAPNMTTAQLQASIAPWTAKLAELGIDLNPVYQEFDNYYDAWKAGFPLESWGTPNIRQASRLFPRENFNNATLFNATFDAYRSVVESGGFVVGVTTSGTGAAVTPPDNSVNPAWREATLHLIMATFLELNDTAAAEASGNTMTNVWAQSWRDVTPGSGAYLSESDYMEPDFQQSFWGSNYDRLYSLKQQYDPLGVFYAHQIVGSENWQMSENIYGNLPSQNSKLCRA